MAAITVREMSLFSKGERTHGDQGIVKHGDYGGNAVNPFKTEAQINQHSGEGIDSSQ